MKQPTGFTGKKVTRLEMLVVKVAQKPDARVEKAEPFLVEVQCVPGLAE